MQTMRVNFYKSLDFSFKVMDIHSQQISPTKIGMEYY